MPNSARPSLMQSSMDIFSATRMGSFHGNTTTIVPSQKLGMASSRIETERAR